jgi:hypothetical protein
VLHAAVLQDALATGRRLRIGTLLRRGGLRVPVGAPEAGLLTLELTPPPRVARRGMLTPGPIFASGTLRFTAPGRGELVLKATHLGRVRLAHKRRVRLAVWSRFVGSSGVTTVEITFTVRR